MSRFARWGAASKQSQANIQGQQPAEVAVVDEVVIPRPAAWLDGARTVAQSKDKPCRRVRAGAESGSSTESLAAHESRGANSLQRLDSGRVIQWQG